MKPLSSTDGVLPSVADAAILAPSLQAGAACGAAGFLFGGVSGILKGTTPFLFATASGIQTFVLGTAFWATRTTILQAWNTGNELPNDRVKASAIAGGISGGAIALITRGRRNVLPATIMWSLIGGVGQITVHKLTAPREQHVDNFWVRMAKKEWSPVTVMTDEEYAKILRDRVLKVDAEISILDDRIAALKQHQAQEIVAATGAEKSDLSVSHEEETP